MTLGLAVLASCASRSSEPASAGVPGGPIESAAEPSMMALTQGLQYVREHPSQREDERIQRYLWLDEWVRVLKEKNRLSPEMAKEFWGDLTNFIKDEPSLGISSTEKVVQGAQSAMGKNIAHFHLYQLLLKDQSFEASIKNLEAISEDGTTDLYPKAQDLLSLVKNKPAFESKKIGVLLPLSGDLKPLADEVLQAIQVASNLGYASGIEFVFEDTGTSEKELLEAWDKLALQEKVSAIIGPLTSKDSEIIFERAQMANVPVISLAPKESLKGFGSYGFRSVLTLEDQVKRLAKFISNDLGAKRVAILMPDSNYGWDATQLAKKEFEGRGLSISHLEVYAPGSTDFKEPLRRIARLDIPRLRKSEVCPKELKEGESLPEGCVKKIQDLKPLIDFEVLFVPDSAETVGFLLPTLPYLRIYGVQVVGLSQYNSSKLLERAGPAAEGVILTDSYIPNSAEFPVRFFKEQYQKLTQREPSRLAAEAFDTALVLINVLRSEAAVPSREVVVDRLKGIRDFRGVTGNLFVEDQKLKKEPKLLVVRSGSFQELK